MSEPRSYLTAGGEGVLVALHVVPRAARTRIVGEHGGRLKVQVAAPPVEGAANDELVAFFARRLRVARGAVTVVRGASGRQKTLAVEGIDPATAAARLAAD